MGSTFGILGVNNDSFMQSKIETEIRSHETQGDIFWFLACEMKDFGETGETASWRDSVDDKAVQWMLEFFPRPVSEKDAIHAQMLVNFRDGILGTNKDAQSQIKEMSSYNTNNYQKSKEEEYLQLIEEKLKYYADKGVTPTFSPRSSKRSKALSKRKSKSRSKRKSKSRSKVSRR